VKKSSQSASPSVISPTRGCLCSRVRLCLSSRPSERGVSRIGEPRPSESLAEALSEAERGAEGSPRSDVLENMRGRKAIASRLSLDSAREKMRAALGMTGGKHRQRRTSTASVGRRISRCAHKQSTLLIEFDDFDRKMATRCNFQNSDRAWHTHQIARQRGTAGIHD
jgi:hypothetical protein